MKLQSLNGEWSMRKEGVCESYAAHVPTTVYQVLLEHGVMDDPFYGENDIVATGLSDDNYYFTKMFYVDESLFLEDFIELHFKGLDTIATIRLNEEVLDRTKNMHREYVFEVKDRLKVGENKLEIFFESPTKFIAEKQEENPIWGVETTLDGYEYLRKAHCMFGWDWGPKLPDMGIWRDVLLKGYSVAKIDGFYVKQKHMEDEVILDIHVEASTYEEDIEVMAFLYDNYGDSIAIAVGKMNPIGGDCSKITLQLVVEDPKLWWPNGYGEQELYKLKIRIQKNGTVYEESENKIGLRTMTVTREKDEWGESFDFTINGKRIFAMGADYIPEDALITRPDRARTERLIKDCVKANYNCLRVWGGGFYPDDDFFDLCDMYGLLVWEDFMFACGVYEMTDEFQEEVIAEFRDNIRRIRHHACLGLWCGNNEMEWAFEDWDMPKTDEMRADYLLLYEKIIPEILGQEDPNTFYWPASPSSGGGFDDPNGDNKGDVHYWQVFHGNEHYKAYRDHYFKFASEYGMQAFPDYKTVESYAPKGQQNIFGPIMENHNKCIKPYNGNVKILLNMAGEFKLPMSTEEIVYLSQVFQGEAIKCAVEHFRRNRGRCMGSTYWQVNDNNPVASWASIDYFGRWKAMHYFARRFYKPMLVSGYEDGTKGHIYITNETLEQEITTLKWQVRDLKSGVLEEDTLRVSMEALSAKKVKTIDMEAYFDGPGTERTKYVSFQLYGEDGEQIASETILFCPHKHFYFEQVDIEARVKDIEGKYVVEISADKFAKSVGIQFTKTDFVLSDNYFDILPGETRRVYVEEIIGSENITALSLQKEMKIYTVNNLNYEE